MKKLKYTKDYDQLIGNVIEFDSNTLEFQMREYTINKFGKYIADNIIPLPVGDSVVLSQKDLVSRVKRIHYMFPEADFISANAVDVLNLDNEDVETSLGDVINF